MLSVLTDIPQARRSASAAQTRRQVLSVVTYAANGSISTRALYVQIGTEGAQHQGGGSVTATKARDQSPRDLTLRTSQQRRICSAYLRDQ